MIKCVVFDFDGTIANTIPSNRVIADTLNTIANNYINTSLTEDDIRQLRNQKIMDVIKTFHIPLLKLPFILKKIREAFRPEISVAHPVAGMELMLRHLQKKGFVLGILTSSPKDSVIAFLKRNNLKIFDFIYSRSSLFGKHKHMRRILQEHHFTNNELIYVGDEIRDIESMKKADIPIIAVTWGLNSKKGLEEYSPDFLIDSPAELEKILLKKFLAN